MDQQHIKLGRLHQCTFQQALELRQRGFEEYREIMSSYYPGYAKLSSTEAAPGPNALNRLLDGFGTEGIHPEQSVVCFVDDQPVGFVFIAYKNMNGKKLAWNGGTGVFPEYRGMGIAKAMMLEMRKLIVEQEVDRAVLEVVVKNSPAVKAYQKAGFCIVDKLVGMTCFEPLNSPILTDESLPQNIRLQFGTPTEVSLLPYYREQAAWTCMWHNMKQGESLIAYDETGSAAGYALFTRTRDQNGALKTIELNQCEVSPDFPNREALFRCMLSGLFAPLSAVIQRRISDLSMSNPELIALLHEVGFTLNYEQYLMHLDRGVQ